MQFEDFHFIHSVFIAQKSSLKWLFVGRYRTVVPRYLWYCGTTVVPWPRRYWYREKEVPQFHGSTVVPPNTSLVHRLSQDQYKPCAKRERNRTIRSGVIAIYVRAIWAPSTILDSTGSGFSGIDIAPAYQISTKSGNAPLSYWRFDIFPGPFSGGGSIFCRDGELNQLIQIWIGHRSSVGTFFISHTLLNL